MMLESMHQPPRAALCCLWFAATLAHAATQDSSAQPATGASRWVINYELYATADRDAGTDTGSSRHAYGLLTDSVWSGAHGEVHTRWGVRSDAADATPRIVPLGTYWQQAWLAPGVMIAAGHLLTSVAPSGEEFSYSGMRLGTGPVPTGAAVRLWAPGTDYGSLRPLRHDLSMVTQRLASGKREWSLAWGLAHVHDDSLRTGLAQPFVSYSEQRGLGHGLTAGAIAEASGPWLAVGAMLTTPLADLAQLDIGVSRLHQRVAPDDASTDPMLQADATEASSDPSRRGDGWRLRSAIEHRSQGYSARFSAEAMAAPGASSAPGTPPLVSLVDLRLSHQSGDWSTLAGHAQRRGLDGAQQQTQVGVRWSAASGLTAALRWQRDSASVSHDSLQLAVSMRLDPVGSDPIGNGRRMASMAGLARRDYPSTLAEDGGPDPQAAYEWQLPTDAGAVRLAARREPGRWAAFASMRGSVGLVDGQFIAARSRTVGNGLSALPPWRRSLLRLGEDRETDATPDDPPAAFRLTADAALPGLIE